VPPRARPLAPDQEAWSARGPPRRRSRGPRRREKGDALNAQQNSSCTRAWTRTRGHGTPGDHASGGSSGRGICPSAQHFIEPPDHMVPVISSRAGTRRMSGAIGADDQPRSVRRAVNRGIRLPADVRARQPSAWPPCLVETGWCLVHEPVTVSARHAGRSRNREVAVREGAANPSRPTHCRMVASFRWTLDRKPRPDGTTVTYDLAYAANFDAICRCRNRSAAVDTTPRRTNWWRRPVADARDNDEAAYPVHPADPTIRRLPQVHMVAPGSDRAAPSRQAMAIHPAG